MATGGDVMPGDTELILQGISEIKTDMRKIYDRLGSIDQGMARSDERMKQCEVDRESIRASLGKLNTEIYGEPGRDDGLKERTGTALSEAKAAKNIATIGAVGGSVGGGGLIAKLMGLI